MTDPTPYPPYLTEERLLQIVKLGLDEDVGAGDVTSQGTVSAHAAGRGRFVAKAAGVVAGLRVAEAVYSKLDSAVSINWQVADGDTVEAGDEIGTVMGPARVMLAGERLALNFMQRMSGIATATRRMQDLIRDTGAVLLDTRKTAPGLRPLDKWAVLLGGGANHRMGLFDMILIKENHIRASGSIEAAVEGVQSIVNISEPRLQVEVEVTTLDELKTVLKLDGIRRVMLDNFAVPADDAALTAFLRRLRAGPVVLEKAVRLVDGKLETEASGNVTMSTVRAIAETGVDFISCGALTHSAEALDISLLLDIAPDQP